MMQHKSEPIIRNKVIKQLLSKIQAKAVTVGVIGLGYVGLPFLVEKAKVGLKVIGIDNNEKRVTQLTQSESYIDDISSQTLREILASGMITFTTNFDVIADLDVIVICVPTPLDKNHCPDLTYVRNVTEQIAKFIKPGQLISLESTTYPGTTEEVIQPILEQSGLVVGQDFFLAHSPERVDPGNQRYTTKNTNKVIGGVDENSLQVACAFYKLAIQEIVPVSSAKVAEMVKVYENTYRAVNIALANEIALLCDRMELNVWEVLDAAFTKPFGIMPFYPGPGVGGHCIPIDPHYLAWKAKEYNFQTRFINLAGEINHKMPLFVVTKIGRILNQTQKAINGSKILMLGMSYKANIRDYRESPALAIFKLLKKHGAAVNYHDPFVPAVLYKDQQIDSVELTDELIQAADVVLITTAHQGIDYANVVCQAKAVLDTRYVTKNMNLEHIFRL